jgi:hypothetical protein
LRDHSHAWPASSTGACWDTSKTMDRKVKIVNYIRWLSLVSPWLSLVNRLVNR